MKRQEVLSFPCSESACSRCRILVVRRKKTTFLPLFRKALGYELQLTLVTEFSDYQGFFSGSRTGQMDLPKTLLAK